MNHTYFSGTCTALVTPFLDGQVNYPMMEQLLRRQLDAGIRNFVICGTTGEASTLTDEEKLTLFRRCKAFVGKDAAIIAGTGSNSTVHAVSLSAAAEDCGVDGLLVVSPYYNKATNDGLIAHYRSITEAVRIPVIAYNVPSRTGLDIPVEGYKALCRIPHFIGVKEASTDIRRFAKIRAHSPGLQVWCGNDDMTVAALALGACGLISVLSNVLPELTDAMVSSGLDGDFDTACALQCRLLPCCEALFSQVNPVPVKAALACLGYDCGGCRLPLTEASPETKENLRKILKKL